MISQAWPSENEQDTSYLYQPAFDDLPVQQWPAQWHASEHFPTPQSVGDNDFHRLASEQLSFDTTPSQYKLGDPSLPIAPYRDLIVNTFLQHGRAVISSETGSGKSSNIGLYLLEAGVPRIHVSSPRILAARELCQRAKDNLGPSYAHLAGYETGDSSDSDCSPDARLIYATEQLLFNKINRGMILPGDVIMLDEAHERTIAGVMLLALAKKMGIPILISSATIDTDLFARYLPDQATGNPAPVLILPGRTHPITRLESTEEVPVVIDRHIRKGKNVMAFEPGRHRLRTTWARAQSRVGNESTIHLLHGDQSPSDQAKALNPANGNSIIGTKVAETSLTPQNKDVVVDGGLSNLGGMDRGKRVLTTAFSSQATMMQRMGRVGRTKPGVYVIAIPGDTPPPPAFENRPLYDPPAIECDSVAAYITELLAAGHRLEELDLLENPTGENLRHDQTLLRRLGAVTLMADGEIELTDIGHAMNSIPLDTPLRRMLVEARRMAENSGSTAIHLQVAAAVAVQQVRGILDGSVGSMRRYARPKPHEKNFSTEETSDVLYELDVFIGLYEKQLELSARGFADSEEQFDRYLTDHDILPNRYHKALRKFEELCRREGLDPLLLCKPDKSQRQQIIACQITGAEEVFVQRSRRTHDDIRGDTRRTLGRHSTIAESAAQIVVGTAFDLHLLRDSGRFQKRFITGASAVTAEQLRQFASHRLSEQSVGYGVSRKGALVERVEEFFDGELRIGEREEAPSPTLETRAALIRAMMTGVAPSSTDPQEVVPYRPGTPRATLAAQRFREAQKLEHSSGVNLNIARRHQSLVNRVIRESIRLVPLDVTDPAKLDELIPTVYLNALVRPTRKKDVPEIVEKSPDGISVHTNEEAKLWVDVSYRNNIAHVTIPRSLRFTVTRADFESVLQHHELKIRIGRGKYQHFDAAFALLDKQRQAATLKSARRERTKARVVAAAISVASNVPATRQRPPRRDPATLRSQVNTIRQAPDRRPSRQGLRLVRGGKRSGG